MHFSKAAEDLALPAVKVHTAKAFNLNRHKKSFYKNIHKIKNNLHHHNKDIHTK